MKASILKTKQKYRFFFQKQETKKKHAKPRLRIENEPFNMCIARAEASKEIKREDVDESMGTCWWLYKECKALTRNVNGPFFSPFFSPLSP